MKTLLVDVDDVICFSSFLDEVNAFLNTNYKVEDLKDYWIDYLIEPVEKRERFYNQIKHKNVYLNATIFDNAKEVLEKLNNVYDLRICSSCIMPYIPKDCGEFFQHKYDFLIENFPFLDPENFMFTAKKDLLFADVQIDDRLDNLQGNVEIKLLYDSYHNRNIPQSVLDELGVVRVHNWKEIEKILLEDK